MTQTQNPLEGFGTRTSQESEFAETLLGEGSLRLAVQVPPLQPGLLALYGLGRHWAQPGGVFGLWVSPRGGLVLRHRTNEGLVNWEGPAEFCGEGDALRISYLIWTSLGRGLLRAENGATGATCEARFGDSNPLPLQGAWSDLGDLPDAQLARVPLTPRGSVGFASGDCLPTPEGWVPVESLSPGDQVLADEGPVRVLGREAVPLTPVQRQEAITLRAPYFGLEKSITVLPDQRIRISTLEVAELTAHTKVLSAARDMLIAKAAHPDWEGQAPIVALSLERSCTLRFGQCELVCPGIAIPGRSGTNLPRPGDDPWATRSETVAILDALARRRGVLPAKAVEVQAASA